MNLRRLGTVRSTLRDRAAAPRQGREGAPEAVLEIEPPFADALLGVGPGSELVVLTWLHLADRDVLQVHPRGDGIRPLTGVFATRSPDLHRVTVLAREAETALRVGPLEAVDGTPVVDLKTAR